MKTFLKSIVPLLLLGSVLQSAGLPPPQKNSALPEIKNAPQILSDWRSRFLEALQIADEKEKITKLGQILCGVEHFTRLADRYQIEEFSVLLGDAQAALIAIPGHAEYYESAIKDLQSKLINTPVDDKDKYRNEYWKVQGDGFQVLANLPSPESVRVLGNFLADEIGGINSAEVVGEHPTEAQFHNALRKNCLLAATALHQLIADPPTTEADRYKINRHEKWLPWYEQVKAGNRVYRFKGDPTEYDLNGPAPQQKLVRLERDRKRDAERAAGRMKSPVVADSGAVVTRNNPPASIAGVLAAIGLIGAAVWYFLRDRKAA